MERFTIFRSHYESLKRCPVEVRIEVLDAMLGYAFDGKEPEFQNLMSEALWIAILPVVQLSIKQAQNGSKPKPRNKPDEAKENPKEIQIESKSNPYKKEEVEIEIEEEKEKGLKNTFNVEYEKVRELWNTICGFQLGKVVKLTDSRKGKIKIRAREIEQSGNDYLVMFERIFNMILESDFLTGKRSDWKANFDWIIDNDKNYIKVLEGRYTNQTNRSDYGSNRLSERAAEECFYNEQNRLATAMLLQDGSTGIASAAQDD